MRPERPLTARPRSAQRWSPLLAALMALLLAVTALPVLAQPADEAGQGDDGIEEADAADEVDEVDEAEDTHGAEQSTDPDGSGANEGAEDAVAGDDGSDAVEEADESDPAEEVDESDPVEEADGVQIAGTDVDDEPLLAPLSSNPSNTTVNRMTFYAYVGPGETLDVSMERVGGAAVTATLTVEGPGATTEVCTVPTNGPCEFQGLTGDPGIWRIDLDPEPGLPLTRYDWSIDVRDSGTPIDGRVWAERYVMTQPGSEAFDATFTWWFQSELGYLYETTYHHFNGVNSQIFADATGVALDGTCTSAYRSWDAPTSPESDPSLWAPPAGECGDLFKIFFEEPAGDLPAAATRWDGTTDWVAPPVVTPEVTDVTFTPDSTSVRSGTIAYEVANFTGQLEVEIDTNGDGDFDLMLPGFADAGVGSVYYDGTDADGDLVFATSDISVRVSILRTGEIHFSNSDVEIRSGIEVRRVNGPDPGDTTLYWDDTDLIVDGRHCVTPVLDGTAGVDSSGGVHGWDCRDNPNDGETGSWGDVRHIDDWTFVDVDVSEDILVPAHESPAFECTGTAYLFQSFPTDVWEGDLVTGEFDREAEDIADAHINGVGFNPLDGYIYGWSNSTAPGGGEYPTGLVRVGADYAVEYLGIPEPLTDATTIGHGDVDEDGQYWARVSGVSPDLWVRIDLEPGSPTFGEVAESGDLVPPTGLSFHADWSYNPMDGLLYGIGRDGGGAPHLISFDPTSKATSNEGQLEDMTAGAFGATYMDGDGFLYASDNNSGRIYRVDVDEVTASFFAQGPDASYNDGARCPIPIYTDYGDAPDDYGTLLDADGPRHGLPGYDPDAFTADLMLGTQVGHEAEGQPSEDANADTFDDGVAEPIVVRLGQETTVTVTVTNDTGESATLAGWIDLDLDGTFDDDERAVLTIPAGSGTQEHELTFPEPSASGEATYARFRVFPGAVGDPPPTGPASAGEVEDYRVVGPMLEPWQCLPDGILSQGSLPTELHLVDLVTGDVEEGVFDLEGRSINGMAYNVVDDSLYAWDGTPRNGSDEAVGMVRIGADGYVEELGLPAGLHEEDTSGGKPVGDIDNNGHYWLGNATGSPDGARWYQIDLNPGPTFLQVLGSGTVVGGDMPAGNTWLGSGDWAWVPGGGDNLWRVMRNRNDDNWRLWRLDMNTGEHHNVAFLEITGQGASTFGAAYADEEFLYVSNNTSGDIYRIDVQAGTASFFTDGPPSANNDGARCAIAPIYTDYGDAPDSYGTRLEDDGPRHSLPDYDPDTHTTSLMLGEGVSHETNGQPSAGADADTFDDGVADPIFLVHGEPIEVEVEVTNLTDDEATVAGWIDVAATGTFDPGDRSNLEVVPAGFVGTVTLTFPEGATTQDTYARFRVFGGTFDDPDDPEDGIGPTGPSRAGEVEDYRVLAGRVHYEKEVDPDDETDLQPGDTFTYRVTVSNLGSTPLTDLQFTDDLSDVVDDATYDDDAAVVSGPGTVQFDPPDEVVWSGDLAVGEVAVVEYSVTIDDPPGGDALLLNGVVGTGPGSNCPPPGPASNPECFTEVPQPQVSGVKTSDAAGPVQPDTVVEFTFTVTNDGPAPALNAMAIDDLSGVLDDATYNDDASASSGTVMFDEANQRLVWNGPLAEAGESGSSAMVTYSVTVSGADGLGDAVLRNALLVPGCPDPPVFDDTDPTFDPDCVEIIDTEAWMGNKTSSAAGNVVRPGDTIDYTVVVTNTGSVDLIDVEYLDDLTEVVDDAAYNGDATVTSGPGTVQFNAPDEIVWTGGLAAGQSATVTYSVTVNDADGLGDGVLTNAVTGPDNCPDPAVLDPEHAAFEPDCVDVTGVAAYTVVKTGDPDTEVAAGDTVTYTVEVVNTGGTDLVGADAASFDDDLSGVLDDAVYNVDADADVGAVTYGEPVLSWVGDLPVGASAAVTYSVTVDDPITGDFLLVNAVAGGDCPTPAVTDPNDAGFDPDCVSVIPLPGIHYRKAIFGAAVEELEPGDTYTYLVTVTNTGQVDLVDQWFEDDLSEVLDDAAYNGDADADLGTVSYSEPHLRWDGDLSVGEVATITYTITIDDPVTGDGILRNVVVGEGNCEEGSDDPDCSTVFPEAVVVVTKEKVGPADPEPGDVVTYRISAHNRGGGTAEAELITDDLSGLLDDATYNGDAAVDAGEVAYTAPVLSWRVDIDPDQTVELTYSVTVDDVDRLGDGQLVNRVTGGITCSPDSDDPDCVTDDPVRAVGYDKTIVASEGDPEPGDTVTYRVTATNLGGAPLHGLSFEDDLGAVLEHATYLDDATTDVGTVSYQAPMLSWEGDLAEQQVAAITYSVQLDDDAPAGAAAHNVVVGDGPGSNCPTDSTDSACIATFGVAGGTADAGDQPRPAGRLPFTGGDVLRLLANALAALLAGSVLIVGQRRRRRNHEPLSGPAG